MTVLSLDLHGNGSEPDAPQQRLKEHNFDITQAHSVPDGIAHGRRCLAVWAPRHEDAHEFRRLGAILLGDTLTERRESRK